MTAAREPRGDRVQQGAAKKLTEGVHAQEDVGDEEPAAYASASSVAELAGKELKDEPTASTRDLTASTLSAGAGSSSASAASAVSEKDNLTAQSPLQIALAGEQQK